MPSLYDRLRPTARRMINRYNTGIVEVGAVTTVAGANPWDAPSEAETWTRIDAVVTGVAQEYVDGTEVISTDRMVITQAELNAGSRVRIDGQQVAVVKVIDVLAAGDPVVSKVVVR